MVNSYQVNSCFQSVRCLQVQLVPLQRGAVEGASRRSRRRSRTLISFFRLRCIV
jgi:hypothetical protein